MILATPLSKNSRRSQRNTGSNRRTDNSRQILCAIITTSISLLDRPEVQDFIGKDDYKAHKDRRFRSLDNKNIAKNEAFILSDPETRKTYAATYAKRVLFTMAASQHSTRFLNGSASGLIALDWPFR